MRNTEGDPNGHREMRAGTGRAGQAKPACGGRERGSQPVDQQCVCVCGRGRYCYRHSGEHRGHDDCPTEPQALEGQWARARARQAQPCGRGHGELGSGNPERRLGLLLVCPTGGTLLGVGGTCLKGW